MDTLTGTPSPDPAPSRPSSTTPLPVREDCWSEEATFTLIEAWGDRYLELNRGNLRQKHWQEVADAVNDRHGRASSKAHRTDVQCKNRIDTLKKKYKIEKARVCDSNGAYTSQWPFFERLDALFGSIFPATKPSPPVAGTPANNRRTPPVISPGWALSSPVPVGLRSGTPRRPAPSPSPLAVDDSYFRRNFSAFAAAAAAAAEDEAAAAATTEEDSEGSRSRSSIGSRRRNRGGDKEDGYRDLAQAIERLGEIYERVEGKKQRQMIELEKQRMQFAKDLEYQRMQLFMETQVQLQKIKRSKRSAGAGD